METPQQPARQASREDGFVTSIIARCQQDKGLAARLRRADNPATEYQSWEVLAGYGVDLEHASQRLPFSLVAAHIAKAKLAANGSLSLGRAIAMCYEDGNQSDQAKARLRRVLACGDLIELCRILRPLLTLIESRAGQSLDCVRLLRQLRQFGIAASAENDGWQQSIKAQWAQEFYGQKLDVVAQAGEAA